MWCRSNRPVIAADTCAGAAAVLPAWQPSLAAQTRDEKLPSAQEESQV